MEIRQLGDNGPELSVVGLGCNNFGMKLDAEQTTEVVHAALDAGITHFDTAEMYGDGQSEVYLGAALGSRRDEVAIATKFTPRPADQPYTPGVLRQRILDACDQSLQRLGTDRIDLYYQHYPDADAPIDEALETLDALVRDGKVVAIASSNVGADRIDAAADAAAGKGVSAFCATQLQWNLLQREEEESTIPAARRHRMGIVPYFPLASGLLTGKYRRGQDFPEGSRFAVMSYFAGGATDENFDMVEALDAFARSRGHSILELAMAWLAAQDGVGSVIAGATTPEQVRTNVAAAEWLLAPEDLAAIDAIGP